MNADKIKKMEELRKKLLQLDKNEWDQILDTSKDKPQHYIDNSERMRHFNIMFSEEARKKSSESHKGKKPAKETIEKIVNTKREKGILNAPKPEHVKQAARLYQLQRTKEERQKAFEKVDIEARTQNYRDKEAHRQKALDNMRHKMKTILAFKDNILVGTYESIMQASRELNLNAGSITSVLSPKYPNSKSTKGYTFQYKELPTKE